LAKQDITIATRDGTAKAGLFRSGGASGGGQQPGVILYMDAFGPRPALDGMAERLAEAGYVVLVPDLFYRSGAYGPFDAATGFKDPATRGKIMGLLHATTQAMTAEDSGAFIEALTKGGATGRIGTVGYCMGGARAITAAATYPDRIAAAASFHGGNLAGDAPDSPHLGLGKARARFVFGHADHDKSMDPDAVTRLGAALDAAGLKASNEIYAGAPHGYTMADTAMFHAEATERHFTELRALLDGTLKG
jgi:carboxymethylenebutenolidase